MPSFVLSTLRLLVLIFLTVILSANSFGKALDIEKGIKKQPYGREYTLRATMLGYFDLEGTRNPVLRAQKGETVRIHLINGEPLIHDIVLEKAGISSETLSLEGDTTSIVFKAEESDVYFCSVPGHRLAGMEGKFEVVEGAITERKTMEGTVPQKEGRMLNLNFETGDFQDWEASGEA